MQEPIVIVGAARTPLGAFSGQFKKVPAPVLGASAVAGALNGLALESVQELVMGCVLPAGVGQAPARQAGMRAGLPISCPAVTINKVCGSGLKAIEMAYQCLRLQGHGIFVAGGMENMSLAPHLLSHSRSGLRLGSVEMQDHMFVDGLEDARDGLVMGEYAEQAVTRYGFTREQQDEFALRSLARAQASITQARFCSEISPVHIEGHKDDTLLDEIPRTLDASKIPRLKPAFRKEGTVTAANASSLSDGAAALALTTKSIAVAEGYKVMGCIHAMTTHSQQPEFFTTAPVPAIQKLLHGCGKTVDDIDLWEINEAFAVVTMAAIQDLNLDVEKVNVYGGACALGHPLGATGARIVVTLLNALARENKQWGVASLCIGGGEGMAILVERVDR